MIERQARIEDARWVEGDLGVHFVYTAGVAGEEFLRALAKGKVLASTCDACRTTYCPPRIFCEACFAEVSDRHEVPGTGVVESVTRLEVDAAGKRRPSEWVAAIRLDGTDATLVHRLEGEGVAIGSRVEPVWAAKRTGSILDISRFRPLPTVSITGRAKAAEPETDGGKLRPRSRVATRTA